MSSSAFHSLLRFTAVFLSVTGLSVGLIASQTAAAADPSDEIRILSVKNPPRLLTITDQSDIRRHPAYKDIRAARRLVTVFPYDEVWQQFAINSRASVENFNRKPLVMFEYRDGPKAFTGFQLNVPATFALTFDDAVALSARYLPENYLSLPVTQPARKFESDFGTHWCREAENANWSLLKTKDGRWLIRGGVESDDFCRNTAEGEAWEPGAAFSEKAEVPFEKPLK